MDHSFPTFPKIKSKKKGKTPKTKVVANYYPVRLVHSKTKAELFILSWSISLGPEVPLDSRRVYEMHIKANREKIRSKIGFFLFSGQKIYSIGDPKSVKEGYHKFEPANEEHQPLTLNLDKNVYGMTQVGATAKENGEITKVLNLIVKAVMQKMGLQELDYNKKYYDNKPHELTIGDWSFLIKKGIKSSVNVCEQGIMINLDYNLRITRYYNLWEEFLFLRDQGRSADQIIESNVIGRNFILMHANHRTIRVDRVDRKMRITDAFPNKKFKNFIDYFQTKYSFKLTDKNQFFCVQVEKNYHFPASVSPGLIKRNRNGRQYVEQENVYPSELLRPTGMLDEQRKDFRAMQQFAKFTKLFPDQRMERIEDFVNDFNAVDPKAKNRTNARAIDLGADIQMVIEKEANLVNGTIFPFPAIKSGEGSMKPNPKNGNYVMKNRIFTKGFQLRNYAVVYDRFQERNVDKVVKMLKKCSTAYGIKVHSPSVEFQVDNRNVDPERLLQKILDEDDRVDMVLFVVGNRNRIYDSVKAYFTRQDMRTQFFTNIGHKTNLSVYSKVLLQQVAKLNGVLWQIESSFDDKKQLNCLMGIDIVHSRGGLVVSLVSTTDKGLSQHYSVVDRVGKSTKKDTRLLVADKIAELFAKAQDNFRHANDRFPDNVIVYRIGSGNSIGLDEDLRYEAALCQAQIDKLAVSVTRSKLVYFAVARQITERIFERNRNQIRNPKGGLIVSEGIVRKGRYEFFMVAQNVNQGSATPTKYTCVFNSSELSHDELSKTTYYQTFNYANWQGPVKVPGVAMYALKCSQFWADNTKKKRNELNKMFESDFLYFL